MRTRRAGLWLALLALTFLAGAVQADEPASANSNHVVIISLDGMRPEFYLPGDLSAVAETLTSLRDAGSYAKGAFPPYPSMTYCGHASIATGVFPARHGVTANSVFEPIASEGRGFFFASDIKVPALWDIAHKAGLTVGAVSWPTTVESKSINWDVPELFTTPLGNDLELTRRYATPGLLEEIERSAGPLTAERMKGGTEHDDFLAASAIEIIRLHKPNLMLIHLIETDKEQHSGGRSSPKLPMVLRRADGRVYDIIEATKKAGIYEQTTFIILGDHGFANVEKAIAPNVLLAEKGFITLENKKVTDWKAMVQNTGGSAGVYLRDPKDDDTAKTVRTLLEAKATDTEGKRLYQIIDKEQLVKLGGPRNAAFYLEGEPGYMFSGSTTGAVVRTAPLKGNHGYRPDKPGLQTGFIATGRGIKKGVVLDSIRLVDVAPTVAELLGLRLDNTDGRTLKELLQ